MIYKMDRNNKLYHSACEIVLDDVRLHTAGIAHEENLTKLENITVDKNCISGRVWIDEWDRGQSIMNYCDYARLEFVLRDMRISNFVWSMNFVVSFHRCCCWKLSDHKKKWFRFDFDCALCQYKHYWFVFKIVMRSLKVNWIIFVGWSYLWQHLHLSIHAVTSHRQLCGPLRRSWRSISGDPVNNWNIEWVNLFCCETKTYQLIAVYVIWIRCSEFTAPSIEIKTKPQSYRKSISAISSLAMPIHNAFWVQTKRSTVGDIYNTIVCEMIKSKKCDCKCEAHPILALQLRAIPINVLDQWIEQLRR